MPRRRLEGGQRDEYGPSLENLISPISQELDLSTKPHLAALGDIHAIFILDYLGPDKNWGSHHYGRKG